MATHRSCSAIVVTLLAMHSGLWSQERQADGVDRPREGRYGMILSASGVHMTGYESGFVAFNGVGVALGSYGTVVDVRVRGDWGFSNQVLHQVSRTIRTIAESPTVYAVELGRTRRTGSFWYGVSAGPAYVKRTEGTDLYMRTGSYWVDEPFGSLLNYEWVGSHRNDRSAVGLSLRGMVGHSQVEYVQVGMEVTYTTSKVDKMLLLTLSMSLIGSSGG